MDTPEHDPAVVDLSRGLLPEIPELGEELAERIREEVPFYVEDDRVPMPELVRSCQLNLDYILGTLAGVPEPVTEPPRATGAARATQGVPYAAVLHAFRIGGRFVWELMVERADEAVRDRLLPAAADIWTVSDQLAAQVTDGYRQAFADLARRDEQRRSALLGTLLDDVPADDLLGEAASLLGLPAQGAFVVAVAQGVAPGRAPLPDVEERLARRDVVSVWRLEADHQEGLVSLRPGYGVDRLVEELRSLTESRVGLSPVFERLDAAQTARREARVACVAATPGGHDVVRHEEHPTAMLLAAAPEAAYSFATTVLGDLLDLGAEDRDPLVQTARTWLAEGGSTSAAAEVLHLHRNTVRYRLRRIEQLTGRDLGHPVDATELHLALEAARISDLG